MSYIEDADGAPYPEGVQAIARERGRQINELGFDAEHDEQHSVADLVVPAIKLLGGLSFSIETHFTLKPADPNSVTYMRDDLVRAGALVAAAIDLLDSLERTE